MVKVTFGGGFPGLKMGDEVTGPLALRQAK